MALSFLLADPFGPFGHLGRLVGRGGLLRMFEWLAVQHLVGLLFSLRLLRFRSPGILPIIWRDVGRLLQVFLLLNDLLVVVGVLVVLCLVLDHVVDDAGRRVAGAEVVEVGVVPVFIVLLEVEDELIHKGYCLGELAMLLKVGLQEGLYLHLGKLPLRLWNGFFENINALGFFLASHVVNFQFIIIKLR